MAATSLTLASATEKKDPKAIIRSIRDDIIELENLISDLLIKLQPMAAKYEGYWLQKTWVLNKLKKKYYYYYLKSKTRDPRSVYVGSLPEDYHSLRTVKHYIRFLEKTKNMLDETLVTLLNLEQHLDFIIMVVNAGKVLGSSPTRSLPNTKKK